MKKLGTQARIKLITAIALTTLLVVFVILNMEVIEVNVIFAKISIRRSVMIFAAFVVGVLFGWAINPFAAMRSKQASKD